MVRLLSQLSQRPLAGPSFSLSPSVSVHSCAARDADSVRDLESSPRPVAVNFRSTFPFCVHPLSSVAFQDLQRAHGCLHPRVRASAYGESGPSNGSQGESEREWEIERERERERDRDSAFCIIEGRDAVQDFARMQLAEIRDGIASRRNRIFLLMEEVRRLRIQQRIKNAENEQPGVEGEEEEVPDFPSSIPFLPPLTSDTLKRYYAGYITLIAGIIVFGGFLAPTLELRLGLGGTSYEDFIRSLHLPLQLSQVDPIVASFSGGAVGVISALLVVEVNNADTQAHKRCKYCLGTGYLACARCAGLGTLPTASAAGTAVNATGATAATTNGSRALQRCPNCAGSTKVMCPTCLCTGMALATEHDPRIDPFD